MNESQSIANGTVDYDIAHCDIEQTSESEKEQRQDITESSVDEIKTDEVVKSAKSDKLTQFETYDDDKIIFLARLEFYVSATIFFLVSATSLLSFFTGVGGMFKHTHTLVYAATTIILGIAFLYFASLIDIEEVEKYRNIIRNEINTFGKFATGLKNFSPFIFAVLICYASQSLIEVGYGSEGITLPFLVIVILPTFYYNLERMILPYDEIGHKFDLNRVTVLLLITVLPAAIFSLIFIVSVFYFLEITVSTLVGLAIFLPISLLLWIKHSYLSE